jgi:uncharacterized protein YprB with RNaseH-like and TPR domain
MNLKARLKHYHSAGSASISESKPAALGVALSDALGSRETSGLPATWSGWTEAGFKTLKRELFCELGVPAVLSFSRSLAVLVPDLLRLGRIPMPEELLFFDLETTGLSGGAGTIAFLAAFGRFTASKSGNAALALTQYLLLDYPGESEFIESVVKEFAASPDKESGGVPVVVSYNGKCFDSQILKNRCLLNRIHPPEYYHADLLHPSRRLWKKMLSDCSQATIEVSVLGLDRTGDVSGAMAPEIWFSFLKDGDNRELLSVCDHNVRDITGLAALFLALGKIAADPFKSRNSFNFDEKALALSWWKAVKKHPLVFEGDELCVKTAFTLLEAAAKGGSPYAAIILAKDAEWRLKDIKLALTYTLLALAAPELSIGFHDEIEKRLSRLEKKL